MDPQQRLLLEVAWEALENAGITRGPLRGTADRRLRRHDAQRLLLTRSSGSCSRRTSTPTSRTGNAPNFAAGRLSYFLGARGPAVVVDTACSSSLVAIHLACQSLRCGRDRSRAGRRRQSDAVARQTSIACSSWRDAVAGRPVQDVRRRRGRLSSAARVRGGGAQAARRCAARRGPGAGGGPRFGGQPGRPMQRPDGPQRRGPAGGAARGLRRRAGSRPTRSTTSRRTAPERSWAIRSKLRGAEPVSRTRRPKALRRWCSAR